MPSTKPSTHVLLPLLLVIALGLSACGGNPAGSGKRSTSEDDPPKFAAAKDGLYCNIAEEAGLQDQAFFGRGISFSDVDLDGDDDVFVANTDGRKTENFGTSAFYLNDGAGRYERKDVGFHVDDLYATWGASFADYDNDGDPDALITNGGYTGQSNVALYRNEMRKSGQFVNVSEPSGIAAAFPERQYWASAWDDYDSDGNIDFVVVSLGDPVKVMRNDGDGTFSDSTAALGISDPHVDAHNPVWFDYDGDKDRDLFIPDMEFMTNHSQLYENRVRDGGGFAKVTGEKLGVVFAEAPGIFAAAAADFNQDGLDDLFLGRWSLQDLVLVSHGKDGFTAHGKDVGLNKKTMPITLDNRAEQNENSMGLNAGNFDGNGVKVFMGTGNPEFAFEDIVWCSKLDPANPAGFVLERCSEPFVKGQGSTFGHGMAFSDTDRDGDTDIVWAHGGHPERGEKQSTGEVRQWTSYFESRTDAGLHTASVFLVGDRSGTDAFGARVKSTADGVTHYDAVRTMHGFSSQNSKWLLIDTGKSGVADLEIAWPSGKTTTAQIKVQTNNIVHEDGGVESSPRNDWGG